MKQSKKNIVTFVVLSIIAFFIFIWQKGVFVNEHIFLGGHKKFGSLAKPIYRSLDTTRNFNKSIDSLKKIYGESRVEYTTNVFIYDEVYFALKDGKNLNQKKTAL